MWVVGKIRLTLKSYYNKQHINYLILNIMKRIFFVALAATLLAASCQKTEIINPAGGNVMTFSTNMLVHHCYIFSAPKPALSDTPLLYAIGS